MGRGARHGGGHSPPAPAQPRLNPARSAGGDVPGTCRHHIHQRGRRGGDSGHGAAGTSVSNTGARPRGFEEVTAAGEEKKKARCCRASGEGKVFPAPPRGFVCKDAEACAGFDSTRGDAGAAQAPAPLPQRLGHGQGMAPGAAAAPGARCQGACSPAETQGQGVPAEITGALLRGPLPAPSGAGPCAHGVEWRFQLLKHLAPSPACSSGEVLSAPGLPAEQLPCSRHSVPRRHVPCNTSEEREPRGGRGGAAEAGFEAAIRERARAESPRGMGFKKHWHQLASSSSSTNPTVLARRGGCPPTQHFGVPPPPAASGDPRGLRGAAELAQQPVADEPGEQRQPRLWLFSCWSQRGERKIKASGWIFLQLTRTARVTTLRGLAASSHSGSSIILKGFRAKGHL